MTILWCGGEDIDFPLGANPPVVNSSAPRAGYARTDISSSGFGCSNPFPGGAITDCWFSFHPSKSNTPATSTLFCGLVKASVGLSSGLWVGVSTSSASKLALFTYNGTTKTQLAAESGTSWSVGGNLNQRIDVRVASFGASATVEVYFNGALIISFTGDVGMSGTVTSVDSMGISGLLTTSMSEFIVTTEDVRAYTGLVTMALTGAGTLQDWTSPTFSNINQTNFSDANPASSNTNAQEVEYNVTNMPSGTFSVRAVKIAARMAKSATPAVTQVELGYDNGGTDGYGTGATKAVTTSYTTYEQLDTVDPTTSSAWLLADMNGLQLNMKALT